MDIHYHYYFILKDYFISHYYPLELAHLIIKSYYELCDFQLYHCYNNTVLKTSSHLYWWTSISTKGHMTIFKLSHVWKVIMDCFRIEDCADASQPETTHLQATKHALTKNQTGRCSVSHHLHYLGTTESKH